MKTRLGIVVLLMALCFGTAWALSEFSPIPEPLDLTPPCPSTQSLVTDPDSDETPYLYYGLIVPELLRTRILEAVALTVLDPSSFELEFSHPNTPSIDTPWVDGPTYRDDGSVYYSKVTVSFYHVRDVGRVMDFADVYMVEEEDGTCRIINVGPSRPTFAPIH